MLSEKLKIGIIFGGKSVEHDISILSMLQVYHAIDKDKYHIVPFYITKNNDILTGNKLFEIETYQNNNFDKCKMITFIKQNNLLYYYDLKRRKKIDTIDLFIPVLHGAGVEDGTVSAYLDFLNIPYTSSKHTISAVFQDKVLTKYVLKELNIPTLSCVSINKYTYNHHHLPKLIKDIEFPIIIKPYNLGSSIGIKVVHTIEEATLHINEVFKLTDQIIIEKALVNYKEYNQAIFKEITNYHISLVEEVSTTNEMLTFTDKYEQGLNKISNTSDRTIPAIISNELLEQITFYTKKIYKSLQVRGVIRIDYLHDTDNNQLYVNEINTIPGSYAFYLYDKLDISFKELLNKLIKNALYEHKQKNKLLNTFYSNVLSKNNKSIKK